MAVERMESERGFEKGGIMARTWNEAVQREGTSRKSRIRIERKNTHCLLRLAIRRGAIDWD